MSCSALAVSRVAHSASYRAFSLVSEAIRCASSVACFFAAAAHAGAVYAMTAGAVSFGQIVKAGEPIFAAVVGFVLVAVQVAPIVHSYITQDNDTPADKAASSEPREKQLDDMMAEIESGVAAGGAVEVVESPLGDAQDL